ncbi:MAG: DUF2971 domain-containing protein [Pseudomonadota bacterium]
MNKPLDSRFDHPLPPQLLEATNLFQAFAQRELKREERRETPKTPLYHYTAHFSALEGILTNQHLWCFSHLKQKDANEFAFALEQARRAIRDVGAKSKDWFARSMCACLDDMLEHNPLAGPFDFFLFSLSRVRDDPNQWRDYADTGKGYAIGLSSALFQPEVKELHPRAIDNVHVGRVIYGDRPTYDRHRFVIEKAAELVSRIGNRERKWVDLSRPGLFFNAMAREVLASQLIWNCLTAKESQYRIENEVRLITMGVSENFDADRKLLGDRPYIESALPLKVDGHVTEIIVGCDAPLDIEDRIKAILTREGYGPGIPVIRSGTKASAAPRP